MTRVGRKNLTMNRVKSIIGRISGAWGHVFRRHTLCLWLTIRGGRIRVAHPRKHQTRVSRQKSGGYPVAAGETNPGESACPSVSLLLFPLHFFCIEFLNNSIGAFAPRSPLLSIAGFRFFPRQQILPRGRINPASCDVSLSIYPSGF